MRIAKRASRPRLVRNKPIAGFDLIKYHSSRCPDEEHRTRKQTDLKKNTGHSYDYQGGKFQRPGSSQGLCSPAEPVPCVGLTRLSRAFSWYPVHCRRSEFDDSSK